MSKNNIKEKIKIRPSNERGHSKHGWLDSFHTFSFADYHDNEHMGYRSLRVINEDKVGPGEGFGAHPHMDMEIFSYVIEGALAHKDSMDHQSTIKAGDIQKITAGTGIVHSEFNASKNEKVHFLQIWIIPEEKNLEPSYQEYSGLDAQSNSVELIGSPKGGKNIIQFNQDVYVYKGKFDRDINYQHELLSGRGAWLQMIKGQLFVNNYELNSGDGASIENTGEILLTAGTDCEFLLIDMK